MERLKYLRQIIKDNDGKAKIYIAANVGEKVHETGIKRFGYQYVFNSFKTILPPDTNGNDARHFTIDLTSESNAEKEANNIKLKYIIALSMTYIPANYPRKNTMDFLFIVKPDKNGVNYATDYAICVFDRYKFYEVDEIYSSSEKIANFKQINLKQFIKFYNWEKLSDDYSKNNRFWITYYREIFSIYGFKAWWKFNLPEKDS